MKKADKFNGFDIVDVLPEDAWLKGYFFASSDDVRHPEGKIDKAYRNIDALRQKDFILHLLDINNDERILDVGCAEGAMMVYCGLLGAQTFGIDIASEYIELANKYLQKFGIKGRAFCADAKKIDFPDNYFDKAVSSDFFEHINSKEKIEVLKEVKRVLKPGGIFVVRTPNLSYLCVSCIFKRLKALVSFKNPFDVVIPHTKGKDAQHIGLTTKKELLRVIKEAGFYNFEFRYGLNPKIEKLSYTLAEFLSRNLVLRDIFTQDIVCLLRKPVIQSFSLNGFLR